METMIYEEDARVVVETSEGTHMAKVELDEGGLYVHVILDQGRYSDGRHRLMVSRADVKLVPSITAADISEASITPTRPTRPGQLVLTTGGAFATTMSHVSRGGSIEVVFQGEGTPTLMPANRLAVVTVDEATSMLVSVPEADQIDPAQPKRDYLQDALIAVQAELEHLDQMGRSDHAFHRGRQSGLRTARQILETLVEAAR